MRPSHTPFSFQVPGLRGYTRAGLTKDCRYVYFYNLQRVSVHQLLVPRNLTAQKIEHLSQEVLHYAGDFKDTMIQRVSLSGQYIAISTSKRLEVFKMRSHATAASVPESTIFRRAHGEWETTALTLHEHDSRLSIVIGQRKRGPISFEGQVLSVGIELPVHRPFLSLKPCIYGVPRNDFPKDVDVNVNGSIILCRTQLHNSVIVWDLSSNSSQRSFQLTRSFHTPVSVAIAPCSGSYFLTIGTTGNGYLRNNICVHIHIVQGQQIFVLHHFCLNRTLAPRRGMVLRLTYRFPTGQYAFSKHP